MVRGEDQAVRIEARLAVLEDKADKLPREYHDGILEQFQSALQHHNQLNLDATAELCEKWTTKLFDRLSEQIQGQQAMIAQQQGFMMQMGQEIVGLTNRVGQLEQQLSQSSALAQQQAQQLAQRSAQQPAQQPAQPCIGADAATSTTVGTAVSTAANTTIGAGTSIATEAIDTKTDTAGESLDVNELIAGRRNIA